MNDRFEEEAAVATDAYIDWLLDARHAGPHSVEITSGPDDATRRTITLLTAVCRASIRRSRLRSSWPTD